MKKSVKCVFISENGKKINCRYNKAVMNALIEYGYDVDGLRNPVIAKALFGNQILFFESEIAFIRNYTTYTAGMATYYLKTGKPIADGKLKGWTLHYLDEYEDPAEVRQILHKAALCRLNRYDNEEIRRLCKELGTTSKEAESLKAENARLKSTLDDIMGMLKSIKNS